jgi:hypothetical protein
VVDLDLWALNLMGAPRNNVRGVADAEDLVE